MSVETTQKTLPAEGQGYARSNVFPPAATAMVVIDAGTGNVAIEADLGDGTWIALEDSPWSADAAFKLEVGNGRFRFTPSGDAKYSVTVLS